MNPFAYRPGTWQVVAESTGVVAVPGDVPSGQIAALTRMLQAGVPQLTDVIDVLAAGSITSLGSFAVALLDGDSARFAVRGPVSVRLSEGGSIETVSGADVSTWTERFIAAVDGFELQFEEVRAAVTYPIGSGVVLAAAVRRGSDPAERPAAAEQSAMADEPPVAEVAEASSVIEPPAAPAASAAPATPVEDAAPASEDADPVADAPADSPNAEPEGAGASGAEGVGTPEAELRTLIPSELTIAPDAAESTVVEPVLPASVLAEIPPAPPLPDELGDHDGATVTLAELRRRRAEADGTASPDAPTVQLPSIDVSSAPSAHGVARLSTGQVVTLDRTVIIGRRPRSTRASGDTMPHLVAVDSPQQDISRSHLEIRPEGDSVVIIDLHTTNGSTLLRPGADPVRLHPGEQTLVLDGDVVDLGDGVTVAFEGLT